MFFVVEAEENWLEETSSKNTAAVLPFKQKKKSEEGLDRICY